jgi:hypothetical protein
MRQQIGKIIITDLGQTPFLKLAKRCQKKYKAELIPASTRKKTAIYSLLTVNLSFRKFIFKQNQYVRRL